MIIENFSKTPVTAFCPSLGLSLTFSPGTKTPVTMEEYHAGIKFALADFSQLVRIAVEEETVETAPALTETHSVSASEKEEIKKELLELKVKIKNEKNGDKKAVLKKQFNDLKLKFDN